MTCASCGAAAPEGARFCPSCGHALAAPADERRVVTVVFADLVGYTALSETRDPEHVKNIVDESFQRLAADVTSYGGRVDKVVGDALVALFGAPIAHEDDAERAVRAALQMQNTLRQLAEDVGVDMRLRVGVNTGPALVGGLRAGGDYTAMGDVVNVASRLQTIAHPGQVVVGAATHAATRGVMNYEALGPVQARGREAPIEAWIAVEALAPPGRRPRRARTPLIGRDAELNLLRHALAISANRSRTHVMLLLGEAGMGKSRLAEELAFIASEEYGALVLEGRCVPYGEANAWWPIAEAVQEACDIGPDDSAADTSRKLRAKVIDLIGLGADDATVDDVTHGLLHLMGHEGALQDVDPTRAPQAARLAVEAVLQGLAQRQPVVIVLSELHWADALVLELIDELLQRAIGLPVVLVATARPELEHRWAPPPGRHNALILHLEALAAADAERLLTALTESPLPDDLARTLLERSDGNPLFLEEQVALLTESGSGRTAGELPATLRGLVAARIDALTPASRLTLEDAAVTGRTGTLPALAALAASRGESDAAPAVFDLVAREFLAVGGPEWQFRTDVVREVAYETLTKAERARRHSALAIWLSERRKELGREDEQLEQIARHFAAAAEVAVELGRIDGVPDDIRQRALHAIERAAMRAKQREMNPAAIDLYDRALRLLDGNDLANRHRVLLARARARSAVRSLALAHEDIDEVLARAGDTRTTAAALTALGDVLEKEGDTAGSLETLDRAIALWRQVGDPQGTADALRLSGMAMLFAGRPDDAEGPIAEALGVFRQAGDRQGEAWALQNLAWIAFSRGQMGEAESRLDESATVFRAIGDKGGLAWALGLLGYVHYFQGRFDEAGRIAQRILGESRAYGDKWGTGMTLMLLASVHLFSGRPDQAIAPARDAQRLFNELENDQQAHQGLGVLVRSLISAGRPLEAIEELAGAPLRHAFAPGALAFGNLVPALAYVQMGDPGAVLEEIFGTESPEPSKGEQVGAGERQVVIGIALMQLGRVDDAVDELRSAHDLAHTAGERAYARAALSLALAAAGDAAAVLELLDGEDDEETARSTYLDRAMAGTARGFALIGSGRPEEGIACLDTVVDDLDDTGDLFGQTLQRLALGRALEALGDRRAEATLADAHARLEAMGVGAPGWEEIYRAAARAAQPATAG